MEESMALPTAFKIVPEILNFYKGFRHLYFSRLKKRTQKICGARVTELGATKLYRYLFRVRIKYTLFLTGNKHVK